jgi:exopolysaccharide biosynthesis protein
MLCTLLQTMLKCSQINDTVIICFALVETTNHTTATKLVNIAVNTAVDSAMKKFTHKWMMLG